MAGDLVVGLVEVVGTLAVQGVSHLIREWRQDRVFDGLDADRKRAVLEIAVAAIAQDGQVSVLEQRWLETRRAAEDGADAAMVDEAVHAVAVAMPGAIEDAKVDAFIRERAARLGDDAAREHAFRTAAAILIAADREGGPAVAYRYGVALGLPEEKVKKDVGWVAIRAAVTPS
jgi:hypothetical protein